MSEPMFLEMGRATRPEIEAFVARCPVAIVPLGSTEQHGPHLPTATDTIIAEAIAKRTAERSMGLILPGQPYGYAWVWKGVPASLTMNFDSYVKMIHDTAESLASWGVKAIYFMSGHGANSQVVKHALRETISDKIDVKILYGMYEGIREMVSEADSDDWLGDLHAEEIETSLMLALAPELVQMDKAVRDYPDAPADYGKSEESMRHVMNTGVFGDATLATREKGERWLDLAADRSAAFWLNFLKRHDLA
ncbi:creatininase family protein [Sinisalibacter aestuarii]|uniref:Creatinine amidohydrolase n=1 Tax=Sinisalibacter aestuarii TaxID=2949426 RepID=A0ABQ5LS19_9RHOB|nr:creatininase family protein [Sinisalibacter aestuarii]GKY87408.1 creatinine amidohydrolase [Sinisalibacter aestuarii]